MIKFCPESDRPAQYPRRTPSDPQPSYRLVRKYQPGRRNRLAATGRSLNVEIPCRSLNASPAHKLRNVTSYFVNVGKTLTERSPACLNREQGILTGFVLRLVGPAWLLPGQSMIGAVPPARAPTAANRDFTRSVSYHAKASGGPRNRRHFTI